MKCIHKDPYITIACNTDLQSFESEAIVFSFSTKTSVPNIKNNGLSQCYKMRQSSDCPISDIQLKLLTDTIKSHRYAETHWIIGVDDIDDKYGNSIALALMEYLCDEFSSLYSTIPDYHCYLEVLKLLKD